MTKVWTPAKNRLSIKEKVESDNFLLIIWEILTLIYVLQT